MKKYSKAITITIIILILIFVGYYGDYVMSFFWGKMLMSETNSTVKNGYFIDKDNAVRFKLPSQWYVYGSYFEGGNSTRRHIALRSLMTAPLHSESHFYFDYEKLTLESEIESLLRNRMEHELNRYRSSDYYQNLAIVRNEMRKRGFGLAVLKVSFGRKEGIIRKRFVEETKFAFKNNFLITTQYRNAQNKFDQERVDHLIEEIISSFEIGKKIQEVMK